MSECVEPDRVTLGLFDNPTSLIYGIGNVGRQDDGLGWAFIDRLEQIHPRPHVRLRRTYQLGLEDADLISRYTRVLFVDATKDPAVESFTLSRPSPKLDFSFTSHALSVPAILATTQQCFDHVPEAYVLAIRGYQWELQQGLTSSAQRNLNNSTKFFVENAVAPVRSRRVAGKTLPG
jgi:hydrogenase maturation protease